MAGYTRTQTLIALALAAAPAVYRYALDRFTDPEMPILREKQLGISFEELKNEIYNVVYEFDNKYETEEFLDDPETAALLGYAVAVEAMKRLYREKTARRLAGMGGMEYFKDCVAIFEGGMDEFLDEIHDALITVP